jgi:hypothetical protein
MLSQAGPDGSTVHSQWHVSSVEVLHKLSGKQTSFPIEDWISPDSEVTVKAKGTKDVYQVCVCV